MANQKKISKLKYVEGSIPGVKQGKRDRKQRGEAKAKANI
jgi:hypothetical protein